jgi:hypothetical protein
MAAGNIPGQDGSTGQWALRRRRGDRDGWMESMEKIQREDEERRRRSPAVA